MKEKLLEIEKLNIFYHEGHSSVKVCSNINLVVYKHDSLGIVGESGAGKTSLFLSILGLLPKNASCSEFTMVLDQILVHQLKEKELEAIRGTTIGMVVQDVMNSMNPSRTVGSQMIELITEKLHKSYKDSKEIAISALKDIGFDDVDRIFRLYPSNLSGGMIQRVNLAMMLVLKPSLILADEPTSALDGISTKQMMMILSKQVTSECSSLVIASHHIPIIEAFTNRVAVMYGGRIVEVGKTKDVFHHPYHPYTQLLLDSTVTLHTEGSLQQTINKMENESSNNSVGCIFKSKCTRKIPQCELCEPSLSLVEMNREVACFNVT